VISGVHLVFCIKNIERMGDHATNHSRGRALHGQG
jgi:phosphate uptake regulator